MPERDRPMTQTVAASEARQQWSQLLNKVFRKETRVIVEKSGVPVAALVSAEDLAHLTQFEQERAERFRALDESWKAFGGVPVAEVERGVLNAVERYGGRVVFKVIDAASFEGLLKSLRYGVPKYPTVIVEGKEKQSGADFRKAEALINQRLTFAPA